MEKIHFHGTVYAYQSLTPSPMIPLLQDAKIFLYKITVTVVPHMITKFPRMLYYSKTYSLSS